MARHTTAPGGDLGGARGLDWLRRTYHLARHRGCTLEHVFASSSVAAWQESLNPAQLAAVTCGDGPVLVIAGAGTGKTWTLACRVAFLIEQGVPPSASYF